MEKNYLLLCAHNGRGVVNLQTTADKGKMLAETVKAGLAIYSVLELSNEETASFKAEMNRKIKEPEKKLKIVK